MSINPAIWRKVSRSNRRLSRIFLTVAAASVVLCAAGSVLVPFLTSEYLSGALRGFRERRAERDALAPVLVEAKRAGLTFPQVVVSHPAHAGKAVYWDITVASSTSSYAEGRPAWAIVWTNPERVRAELNFTHERVLARVAAVRDDSVLLDYLGRP